MQVTVGLPGSGADYEVTLGSAQVEIIRALDKVEAAGGGAVHLQSGEYLTNAPIRWEYTTTRLAGEGIDLTTLANVAGKKGRGNAIEVPATSAPDREPPAVNIEAMAIEARVLRPQEGMGLYVEPDLRPMQVGSFPELVTLHLRLHRVRFRTTLNAIYLRSGDVNCGPNQDEPGPSMGDIEITRCEFPQSCTNLNRGEPAYPQGGEPERLDTGQPRDKGVYHKVVLWSRQARRYRFEILYNRFEMHRDQYGYSATGPDDGTKVIELYIAGDLTWGFGKSKTAIEQGVVAFNTFEGATRECMMIGDHARLQISGNQLTDSHRIGFFFVRGYRSIVTNNTVVGSWYHAFRIDYCSECIWSGNAAFRSGERATQVTGMTIRSSTDNIVTGNLLRPADSDTPPHVLFDQEPIGDETGICPPPADLVYPPSEGNVLANNRVLVDAPLRATVQPGNELNHTIGDVAGAIGPRFTVTSFGARPDGQGDSTAAIQAAIDAALRGGGTVVFPPGEYAIRRPLELHMAYLIDDDAPGTDLGDSGPVHAAPIDEYLAAEYTSVKRVTIEGNWSVVFPTDDFIGDRLLFVFGGHLLSMSQLILDGRDKVAVGLWALKISHATARVEQVFARHATEHGFVLEACQGSHFEQCSARDNGDDGWSIRGSNALKLHMCEAVNNQGSGFVATTLTQSRALFGGGVHFDRCRAERNDGHGFSLEATDFPRPGKDPIPATPNDVVSNAWIENNGGHGVCIQSRHATVEQCRILARADAVNTRAIELKRGVPAATIRGNHIANNGVVNYHRISADPARDVAQLATGNFQLALHTPLHTAAPVTGIKLVLTTGSPGPAGTDDNFYLTLYSDEGGREIAIDVIGFDDFEAGTVVEYAIGNVPDPGPDARVPEVSTLGQWSADLWSLRSVAFRKAGVRQGRGDDEYLLGGLTATLYGAHPDGGTLPRRTFERQGDIHLGAEHGLEVALPEV